MNNLKKRLTNRFTLIALGSQVLIIAGIIYYYVTGDVLPDGIRNDIILLGGSVLVILTSLGIINNPDTENKGLKDDDTKK